MARKVRRLSVLFPEPAEARLLTGSLAHYADADYYRATYRRRAEDVAFYLQFARTHGGPVLEYGVGNGRIALPMAQHGISVTGVDLSRTMLADLARQLQGVAPAVSRRVRAHHGDMREVHLRKKFPLVFCTFNTALHLYSRQDVERFFARVREHLAPGGRFVVDLSLPHAIDLARDPDRPHGVSPFRYPGAGVVKYKEYFDYDPTSQILDVTMEFRPLRPDAGKSKRPWATLLTHRQFYPREWEALLHYNGFDVEALYGDFDKGPLTRESDVMIWIARAGNDRAKTPSGNKRAKRGPRP